MARKWTTDEEKLHRNELERLYLKQNLTIAEVGEVLGIAESTAYDRLKRLDISTVRHLKKSVNNIRQNITIPTRYSNKLAEFFGVMLGDGHLTHFQIVITLGSKEIEYVRYVAQLITDIFEVPARIATRRKTSHASTYHNVYIGSVQATAWLRKEGLVSNKVKEQVDSPKWIFSKKSYKQHFLRGFFDTDGSVYLLRHGIQIAFICYSRPLLEALQLMLRQLEYSPSAISNNRVYITRRKQIRRFFKEIAPANPKHQRRYQEFESMRR